MQNLINDYKERVYSLLSGYEVKISVDIPHVHDRTQCRCYEEIILQLEKLKS